MSASSPVVSVAIPVKNGGRTIAAAIESVLGQDYPEFEVIVVMAPSDDDTEVIVRSYPTVRLVKQAGTGIVGGFNEGIAAAQGELIAFNGDDDLWMPNKLTAQVLALEESDAVVATCLMECFLDEGSSPPPGFRTQLLDGPHVGNTCETMLARRELFEALNGFDPDFDVAFDVDFFSRVFDSDAQHVVVDQVLVRKRIHPQAQHLTFIDRNNEQLLRIATRSLRRKRKSDA